MVGTYVRVDKYDSSILLRSKIEYTSSGKWRASTSTIKAPSNLANLQYPRGEKYLQTSTVLFPNALDLVPEVSYHLSALFVRAEVVR